MTLSANEGSRTLTGVTPLEPESTARKSFAQWFSLVVRRSSSHVGKQAAAAKCTSRRNSGACATKRITEFDLGFSRWGCP